jgi:two-component system KDP operon response regulator KdpE
MRVRPPKLLIVENEAAGLEPLSESFRLRGYDVTSTADGAHAIARAAMERFDVLVVDLGLFDHVSGLDVIRIVRAFPERPAICAYTNDHRLKPHAQAAGCDAFVLKRGLDDLLARVNRIIASRGGSAPAFRSAAKHRTAANVGKPGDAGDDDS